VPCGAEIVTGRERGITSAEQSAPTYVEQAGKAPGDTSITTQDRLVCVNRLKSRPDWQQNVAWRQNVAVNFVAVTGDILFASVDEPL